MLTLLFNDALPERLKVFLRRLKDEGNRSFPRFSFESCSTLFGSGLL